MTRRLLPWILLLAAGALWLRLPHLDRRPLHTDESVHAIKFLALLEKGVYRYDPHEYHGPTLYYATLPFAWLTSATQATQVSETLLRLVPLAFGLGLILLLPGLADGLGRIGTIAAAALTALSPAFSFYSRYYIHELLLVWGVLLLAVSIWRYTQSPSTGWCILGGFSFGWMHASKETFVFNGAAIAAASLYLFWQSRPSSHSPEPFSKKSIGLHITIAIAVATLTSVVLFTSFFTNPAGPMDSLRTYIPWLSRAGGQTPHQHPWHFYFQLLLFRHIGRGPLWTEGIIAVLAVLATVRAFLQPQRLTAHPRLLQAVAIYTWTLTAIYCAIPYKTPWCLLGFWHGMILLAGVGTAEVLNIVRPLKARLVLACVLAAAYSHLGLQAWRACHPYVDDQRNPFIYAHTLPDILNLVDKVHAAAAVHPDHRNLYIQIASRGGDYWPLPWYLRAFPHVGYWAEPPSPINAPLVITSPTFPPQSLDALSHTHQFAGFFGLRPAVFLQLHVERTLWSQMLAADR